MTYLKKKVPETEGTFRFSDHVGTYVGVFTLEQPLTFNVDRDISPSILLEYMTEGTGPLSSAGAYSVGAVSTKYELENARRQRRGVWPDIHLSLIGHSIPENFTIIAEEENIKYDILEKFWGPHRKTDAFHIFVFPTRPAGRGEILLNDNNPFSKPLIDPKYLENAQDTAVTVEGNLL